MFFNTCLCLISEDSIKSLTKIFFIGQIWCDKMNIYNPLHKEFIQTSIDEFIAAVIDEDDHQLIMHRTKWFHCRSILAAITIDQRDNNKPCKKWWNWRQSKLCIFIRSMTHLSPILISKKPNPDPTYRT